MAYVLNLQETKTPDSSAQKGPSSWSLFTCFSTTSIIVC